MNTPVLTADEIEKIFTYNIVKGEQGARTNVLFAAAKSLAIAIGETCPESREKAVALTNL